MGTPRSQIKHGDRPQGEEDFLRSEGLQEAHHPQGHPVQLARPPCTHKGSAATTVSSRVTVVRPSLCSTRRPRPPRRSCCVSSVWSASTNPTMHSSAPSTSSLSTRRSKHVVYSTRGQFGHV